LITQSTYVGAVYSKHAGKMTKLNYMEDVSTFSSLLIQTERLSTRPGLYILKGDILRPGPIFDKFINMEKWK
jgi:hypothetical protein